MEEKDGRVQVHGNLTAALFPQQQQPKNQFTMIWNNQISNSTAALFPQQQQPKNQFTMGYSDLKQPDLTQPASPTKQDANQEYQLSKP